MKPKPGSETCLPRWATPRTPSRRTLGAAAANVAEALGKSLMPWQQQVLDTALEVDDDGKFVYRQVILTVPRQSGKTTLLLVLLLLRAISEPRQNIRYTAQNGTDARKKFIDDWLPELTPSKFGALFRVRLTNGHEALLFRNGSQFTLLATTLKSGHGGTIDLGILDEAFAHPDARLEQALGPAMITRPQPQLWIVSTAGTFEQSPYLWDKVEKGRQIVEAGINSNVAYFEWSADEGADPGDEATWWTCMPALGRTIPLEAVRADFESMSLSEFRRAFLNQWVTQANDPVIPLDIWNELTDEASQPLDPVAFSYDITPDRSKAAIAVGGKRDDGKFHVEVVDERRGTGWVVPRLIELYQSQQPSAIVCDPAGPAGSLLPDLERAGIPVVVINAKEHAQACGMLYDAAMQGTVHHLGDPTLTAALDGAVKRPLGDAWAWSRKTSSVDIAPLVAVTLALWGTQTQETEQSVGVWDLNDVIREIQERENNEH